MMQQILGLEIGGTKCSVWLGERSEEGVALVDHELFPTAPEPQACFEALMASSNKLLAAHPGELLAVGISCGGPLNAESGRILTPPNLPLWQDIPLTQWVKERLHVPAYLQNDADACALAEWRYGAGRGCQHMIFLTYGTGMGAGLILNGQLFSGATGMGGEIGHVRLSPQGPVGYGKRGSVEGFCSGGGLKQLAETHVREAKQQGREVSWADGEITAKAVAQAARRGDALALAVYDEAGSWLGRALAILVDLLNPERIVIGSIFARSGDLLIPAMEKAMREECLPLSLEGCAVVPCALGEEMGGWGCMAVAETRMQN
jgi:glucokinase